MNKALILFALLISISIVAAGEAYDTKVTHLSADNITSTAYATPFVVLFFAPWCPHCKAFRPTYDDFADAVGGQVGVGDVDCTVEFYLQDLFGVVGYPTVFFFTGGVYYEYLGERTVAGLQNFIDGGYLGAGANPLPEVSSVAAFNYSNFKKFTRTVYLILVSAIILGVVGFLAYVFYFRGPITPKKAYLSQRFQHIVKYNTFTKNTESTISGDPDQASFLRQEIA